MDLSPVSAELYGLSPPEFTSARDAKAAQARKSGDRALAAAIKQLRRPNQAAWMANLLARDRPHRVDELLSLGDRLREAQSRLAGAELRELARQGHRVVVDLVGEAERLAVSSGHRPNASTLRQLQETLDAALADAEAGQAVRAGRLSAPLSYAGLGSVETEPPGSPTADRDRVAAEQASAAFHAAEQRVAELTAELQSAQRRRDRIRDQVEELERQLGQVRAQEADAVQTIEKLESAIATANVEMDRVRGSVNRPGSRD